MPDDPLLVPMNPEHERTRINEELRLYRHFEKEDHAEALTRGEVWISTLNVCRKMESRVRRDPGEGRLHYKIDFAKGNQGDLEF